MSKRQQKKKRNQYQLETDYVLNKKFKMHRISPITDNQERLFESVLSDRNVVNVGSAGTGKSYVSLYLALLEVMEKGKYDKVKIMRSAVQTRDQGFLPGSLEEKMAFYEGPYIDIVNQLFDRKDAYGILKQKGMIEFMSTSFIRGLTFDNTIVVCDEVQNCNYSEIRDIITRMGENSKLILCGDTKQDDLKRTKNKSDKSGLFDMLKVLSQMESFDIIEFGVDDIVRSGLVRDFIVTEEIMEAEHV